MEDDEASSAITAAAGSARGRRFLAVVSLAAVAFTADASSSPASGDSSRLQLTYVANEGFLIAGGERRVLIDALFRKGVSGYATGSSETRDRMERGLAPFDGVDLVLATHHHADHFDPQAVGRHLLNNPRAAFISTRQAVDRLRANFDQFEVISGRVRAIVPEQGQTTRVTHAGITVEVLNLHHGRDRPVENLGFVIHLVGRKLLHVGDTVATPADLAVYDLPAIGIDVALLPFWYLVDDDGRKAVREAIDPREIVVMHVPPPNTPDRYIVHLGGHKAMVAAIHEEFPGAWVPVNELDSNEAGAPGRSTGRSP